MANLNELKDVAEHCSSYLPNENYFTNSAENNISCDSCSHYKQNKCELDLYDKISSSLDQS